MLLSLYSSWYNFQKLLLLAIIVHCHRFQLRIGRETVPLCWSFSLFIQKMKLVGSEAAFWNISLDGTEMLTGTMNSCLLCRWRGAISSARLLSLSSCNLASNVLFYASETPTRRRRTPAAKRIRQEFFENCQESRPRFYLRLSAKILRGFLST